MEVLIVLKAAPLTQKEEEVMKRVILDDS